MAPKRKYAKRNATSILPSGIDGIPVPIYLAGTSEALITDEFKQNMHRLSKDEWLRREVGEYIGSQLRVLAETIDANPEHEAETLIKGKMMGVTEFFTYIQSWKLEAEEGIEANTIDESEQVVLDP